MLATTLAELAHIVGHLAIAVDAATLEPGLLDSAKQALVVDGARRPSIRIHAERVLPRDLEQIGNLGKDVRQFTIRHQPPPAARN